MEKHRLKMFGNKVLRRIFGPKGEEIIGGCRKLCSEELHKFYLSLNIARTTRQDEIIQACRTHGGEDECIQGFCGKASRKETRVILEK
jgi:hypothetical protein